MGFTEAAKADLRISFSVSCDCHEFLGDHSFESIPLCSEGSVNI